MRILLWAPFGAGTHYWGPGTSAYRLYKANKDASIKITLIHGSARQELFPNVYHEQIKIGDLEKKNLLNVILYLIRSIIWILRNRRNYDVFHGLTAYFYTFLPALFFSSRKGRVYIKITGVSGGFTNNGLLSSLTGFSKLRKSKANALSGYISVSSDITKSLIQQGIDESKVFYVPNGVDTERFCVIDSVEKAALRKTERIENVFTICYIGGLTKNKRVLSTLLAIHELLEKGYKIQFLIVGPDRSEGIVETEISEYISKYGLEDVCIRVKHTSTPELYFKTSDVFVLNSEFEGLSNSLLEAMACGLPCIASPASGTVDLIEDGVTGFLTDGSSLQIADKIALLYNNQSLYSKISGDVRKKIVQQFSVDFILNQHVRLFRDEL